MNAQFFIHKRDMTVYAITSGYEIIRCKLPCEHVPAKRPAILLVKEQNFIVARLIRCKVCAKKGGANG